MLSKDEIIENLKKTIENEENNLRLMKDDLKNLEDGSFDAGRRGSIVKKFSILPFGNAKGIYKEGRYGKISLRSWKKSEHIDKEINFYCHNDEITFTDNGITYSYPINHERLKTELSENQLKQLKDNCIYD